MNRDPQTYQEGLQAADLIAHYARLAQSEDPVERDLGRAQLERLQHAQPRQDTEPVDEPDRAGTPGPDLVRLIAAVVGPLHRRSNGTQQGPCPWHASKSGACLVVWPAEGRWWCNSCRRGGDAVAWVALTAGSSFAQARKRLGLPPLPYRARPRLEVVRWR